MSKKIAIGNDHAAVEMKNKIKMYIELLGYEVINVGTDDNSSCDYPDFAFKACKKIQNKEVDLAILICGTGLGMGISANKMKGIRACICSETYTAKMSREHNNCNVLCFGERVVGIETAKEIVKAFLSAEFLGDKHERRVNKIISIENGTYL